MKNEVASLMNNEKLMKIFAVAKINQNYSLFIIHYSLFIKREASLPFFVQFLSKNLTNALRRSIIKTGKCV